MGRRHLCLALATVVTLATQSVSAHAQWNHRAPETPRLRDGTPNLSAPAPRASNGKPDFSGTWQVQGSPISELRQLFPGGENGLGESVASKYFINILADFTPDNAPIQPEAAALYARRSAVFGKDGPITRCLPASIPNAELLPHPHKIVQTSRLLVVLYEMNTSFRQIFLDGRKRPDDPQPAWLGYSIGKWDGDWLVVDTMGFNDRGWLDAFGHSHSDVLHVVERFHRRDFGHLDVQVTIEDPKTFTKPFTIKFTERLMADSDLIESVCQENERDAAHLKDR
jgi:hypothetical protein